MSPYPVQDSPQRKVERLVWLIFSIGCIVFMVATGWALMRSGMFSDKEIVNLLSDHASGLSIGMNVEFNGFPIGRVQNFMLRDDGNVTVVLAMDADQMRWLNGSTRFELQTPLVAFGGGGSKIVIARNPLDSSPFSQDTIHTLVRPSFMADLNQRIEKLLPDIENLIARLSDDQREGSISSLLATTEVAIASLGRVLQSLEQKDSPLEFLIGAESGQTVQDILLEAHELIADVRTKVIAGEQGSIVQVLSTVDATIAAILPSLQHLQEFSAGLAAESPRIGDILQETEESIIEVRLRLSALLNKLGVGPVEPIPLP